MVAAPCDSPSGLLVHLRSHLPLHKTAPPAATLHQAERATASPSLARLYSGELKAHQSVVENARVLRLDGCLVPAPHGGDDVAPEAVLFAALPPNITHCYLGLLGWAYI